MFTGVHFTYDLQNGVRHVVRVSRHQFVVVVVVVVLRGCGGCVVCRALGQLHQTLFLEQESLDLGQS